MTSTTSPSVLHQIPKSVWVLGFVSMLMDISSEMIHSLLPLYMVTVLGASAFTVGIIEGVAEATALIVKVFSGVLSDYLGKRKSLAVTGYALGALTKPLFALSTGWGLVIAARFVDRVGKGIRGAPTRCLGCRCHSRRFARCRVWITPVARYGGGFYRAALGHGLDGVVGK